MSVRNTVKSIQDIMRQDSGVDGDAQRISQLCWMFFLKIIDDQDLELEAMQKDYRSPIPKKFQWRTWAANPEGITGEPLMAFVNDELFPSLKELSGTAKDGRRRVVRVVLQIGRQVACERPHIEPLRALNLDPGVRALTRGCAHTSGATYRCQTHRRAHGSRE